jgi:hypothetical protein
MRPMIQHSSKSHGTAMPISFLLTSRLELVSLTPNIASQLYVMASRASFFSFSDHGFQSTSEEAAQDIAAFVSIFFESFPSFKGRPFHMAGESYGVCFIFLNIFPTLVLTERAPYRDGISHSSPLQCMTRMPGSLQKALHRSTLRRS